MGDGLGTGNSAGSLARLHWWQSPARVGVLVALLGVVPPLTAAVWAVVQGGKELELKRLDQEHEITLHYLELAIDSERSPADRRQVLRFLVKALKGQPIQEWAQEELARVEAEIEELKRGWEAKLAAQTARIDHLNSEATALQQKLVSTQADVGGLKKETLDALAMVRRESAQAARSVADLEQRVAQLDGPALAPADGAPRPARSRSSLEEFRSFLGVTAASDEKTLQRFGEVVRAEQSAERWVAGDGFAVTVSDHEVEISVYAFDGNARAVVEWLRERGIEDSKLRFLGMSRADLIDLFGPSLIPYDVDLGYELAQPYVSVNFWFGAEGTHCQQIEVTLDRP